MARLPYLDRDAIPEEFRTIFDRNAGPNGQTLNLFRVLGYSPRLMQQFARMGNSLLNHSKLDPKLRELAILTVGMVTRSHYEYAQHVRIAKRVGLSDEEIEALPVWNRHPVYSDEARAVVRYAEEATRHVRVSDDTFDDVRSFLDDERLVELVLTVAYYNLVVRFLEPMQIELEPGEMKP